MDIQKPNDKTVAFMIGAARTMEKPEYALGAMILNRDMTFNFMHGLQAFVTKHYEITWNKEWEILISNKKH